MIPIFAGSGGSPPSLRLANVKFPIRPGQAFIESPVIGIFGITDAPNSTVVSDKAAAVAWTAPSSMDVPHFQRGFVLVDQQPAFVFGVGPRHQYSPPITWYNISQHILPNQEPKYKYLGKRVVHDVRGGLRSTSIEIQQMRVLGASDFDLRGWAHDL
eukprot:CAMPEP_0114253932 /NCGR_PEP_ID=MMETSP0058-20121206/16691_1 /TAXON_ID=36894 /ORGANISM="Pyramimonas parkeae, CCMP726" /LENGTH=156 /DNA_ID=CAMNT_0001368081 /DNA_START=378 /DNA_END=852 /DNA_ORIENTATION=-